MSQIGRIFLGLSLVAALVPVVQMVTSDEPQDTQLVQNAPITAFAAEPETTAHEPASVPTNHELGDDGTPQLHQVSATIAAAETSTSVTIGEEESTTSTSVVAESDSTTATTAPSKKSTPTTTKKSSPTTKAPAAPPVGSEITGTVCPCTVTGTSELKGTVNLNGDLMVDGGLLVARPGVKVNGNGYQIMFMNGGRADFQGSATSTWSGDGSNANVSRDINFDNMRRIMFHHGAGKSTLKFFSITNSGTSALGDYSLHFHHNGNSTRGTLVQGVAVVNSKHHAFVPHGSHGITFKDTIAKNGRCDAYWWDEPAFQSQDTSNNSHDIVYDHALADGVTNCSGDNRGFRLSAFHLGAGKGNVVKNSVARNVKPSHAKDCSGFFWPELHHNHPLSWGFANNASYGSACNGIFVWQNNSQEHIVNGFRGDGIDHGAYVNRYDYRNVDVEFIEVHALGWKVTGGSADKVEVFSHVLAGDPVVFTNVSIGSFVVDNASNGGKIPGTYVLNGSGLSCGDIVYGSVVSGTKVVIDGTEC